MTMSEVNINCYVIACPYKIGYASKILCYFRCGPGWKYSPCCVCSRTIFSSNTNNDACIAEDHTYCTRVLAELKRIFVLSLGFRCVGLVLTCTCGIRQAEPSVYIKSIKLCSLSKGLQSRVLMRSLPLWTRGDIGVMCATHLYPQFYTRCMRSYFL